jgi:uncharacterized protein DUF4340
MNESIRTLVFVVVAAVVALTAYATRPNLQREDRRTDIEKRINKPLFPDFNDPLLAKSLEIKQFDEATGRGASSFVVSQEANGQWRIPSHGGYPADAESQLKAVAETLSDLKCIGIASDETIEDKSKEQELYGVKDPDKAEVGMTGVGTLIAIQDGKGNDLIRMIVGKEVAGATNQRFVRKPNEDVVYVTTIDLNKLPTEFDKWIEKDLLKLSTFDVARVSLKDYLLLATQTGGLTPFHRMDADLSYKSDKGEWVLDDMTVYSNGRQPQPSKLGDQEELNKQKLDDLRNALGDLKIVDVAKKPDGLGNNLQVSSERLPRDKWAALQEYGFYPHATASGALDIYGKNGEVLIDTKDGVEYILRFGDIAPQAAVSAAPKKPAKGKAAPEEEQVKVHRYLFVTTQLAPSILKPPELEPEPAGPEPAKDKPDADKKDQDAAKADSKAGEQKAGDQKTDEEKPAVVDPQQAERERVKKENERKMNAYNDQKKKADLKVAELNARFADWYYVVSEDVYKKIRLVRSDIVKESAAAKDEGFGIDAFRKLEEDGLKGTAKPTP